MSDLERMIREVAARDREESLVEGVVQQDVTDLDDGVYVRISGFGRYRWGPMRWMPRPSEDGTPILPQEGDECIVGVTINGEPWMLGYWP
jgi:hypothetical protein